MLTYFTIVMTVFCLAMGLIWSKKDVANFCVKIFMLLHVGIGAYLIFQHGMLG